jgi:hypothetical protein
MEEKESRQLYLSVHKRRLTLSPYLVFLSGNGASPFSTLFSSPGVSTLLLSPGVPISFNFFRGTIASSMTLRLFFMIGAAVILDLEWILNGSRYLKEFALNYETRKLHYKTSTTKMAADGSGL